MIRLKNSIGMVKECKNGFSWTTLFFGLFVPLLRGDLKNSAIMGIVGLLTCGFSWLVYPWFYNKMYIKGLLMQGFTGATEADTQILVNKGFIVGNLEAKEEVKVTNHIINKEEFKKGIEVKEKEMKVAEEAKKIEVEIVSKDEV